MDQSVVVGVGNIYAAESLFLSGIHPLTPAYLVHEDKLVRLTHHIKQILARAITQGGSTLRDFTVGSGKTGYFQQTLLVYGRQGESCATCGSLPKISKSVVGQASIVQTANLIMITITQAVKINLPKNSPRLGCFWRSHQLALCSATTERSLAK